MEARELSIFGYSGQTLQNIQTCQKEDNTHLAVVLPGVGYTFDHPALYYSRMVLDLFGADELRIEPTYRRSKFRAFTDQEKEESIAADAKAILETLQGLIQYTRITLVGKSMGTLILASVLEQGLHCQTEFIWLTPLLTNQYFLETITTKAHRGIYFIGSSDQHYDSVLLEQVKNGQVIVFDGANHSLEIEGDVIGSITIQIKIAQRIQSFVSRVD